MGYSRNGKVGFQSTHCLSRHPLYKTWIRMINRCENQNSKDYKDYGERGITVCSEWRNDFVEFLYWSLKHGWENGLSIERKDVNGNYCPEIIARKTVVIFQCQNNQKTELAPQESN